MNKNDEINCSEIFDYKIVIKKNNKKVFVSIEQLNLFATGSSINDALVELEKELIKLKINYKNFNDENIKYFKFQNTPVNSNNYWIFSFKVFIFFLFSTLSVMYLTTFISKKISQISIIEILKSEKNKAMGLLNNEDKNLKELHNILIKLEPYFTELEKFYEKRSK